MLSQHRFRRILQIAISNARTASKANGHFEDVPLRDHFPDLEPALTASIEKFLDGAHNPEMAMIQWVSRRRPRASGSHQEPSDQACSGIVKANTEPPVS
jgi:hypothetical protein